MELSTAATSPAPTDDVHRGPSLVALAIVHTLLVLGSVIGSTAIAGGEHFPSPLQPQALSRIYFVEQTDAVRLGSFLLFGASVPLGLFAAASVSRLRFLGLQVAGPHIALFGGVAAAIMTALCGLVGGVLSWPEVAATSALPALHILFFAIGGPGYIVPFGLLLAGVSLAGGLPRLLPRWVMWFGLVLAALAELSVFSLVFYPAALLLPTVRFLGLVWLICAGALLPRSRAPRGGISTKPVERGALIPAHAT